VTPAQRHGLQDIEVLEKRAKVYEQAKVLRPLRWKNRSVRDWSPKTSVWLNPPKEHRTRSELRAAA